MSWIKKISQRKTKYHIPIFFVCHKIFNHKVNRWLFLHVCFLLQAKTDKISANCISVTQKWSQKMKKLDYCQKPPQKQLNKFNAIFTTFCAITRDVFEVHCNGHIELFEINIWDNIHLFAGTGHKIEIDLKFYVKLNFMISARLLTISDLKIYWWRSLNIWKKGPDISWLRQ